MINYRALLKNVFYKVGLAGVLDRLLYWSAYCRYGRKNAAFRKANPSLVIPPDYFLYETCKLDYEQFFREGEASAKEILEWTKKYFRERPAKILDWGCGVSRVVMHIDKLTDARTSVYACDINKKMIEFNEKNFKNISYTIVPDQPPIAYEDGNFDLIYALSIFTHIMSSKQEIWIREMHRMLSGDGIFLFTTQGKFYYSKLLQKEQHLYDQEGVFTKTYRGEGHRMMSTYNSPTNFRELLQPYFEVLEYYDGAADPKRIGGQDLWIVKKLPVISDFRPAK